MQDAVGPVLRNSGEVEQVIQAILEDNPAAEVEVIEGGSYVRVQAAGHLRLTLASLRRNLGTSFQMRQLEALLSAFAGKIATTSEEVTWSLTSRPGPVAGDRALLAREDTGSPT
jgi:toluene monooxygenase system protein D